MLWRTDRELIEHSLKQAFRLRDCGSDDRFAPLLQRLREQDETLCDNDMEDRKSDRQQDQAA